MTKPDSIYLYTNFDNNSIYPWIPYFSTPGFSLILTDSLPRAGARCAQFNIGVNDFFENSGTASSARTEIERNGIAPTKKEVYYGWSIKIPMDYLESNDWQVVGQFHDQPDTSLGENWSNFPAHSPPIAYNLKNNTILIAMSTPGNSMVTVATTPITKGVWHDIVTHVYWSSGNDGFVESWIDGIPLTAFNGTDYKYYRPNLYNEAGNFLRLGLYRSKLIGTANTIYYDEVRIGNSFNAVKPR